MATLRIITDPQPFGPQWEKLSEKRGKGQDSGLSCCVFCGRATSKDAYEVFVVGGGEGFCHVEDIEAAIANDDGGNMGVFKVGPTCRRKLPQGYSGKDLPPHV